MLFPPGNIMLCIELQCLSVFVFELNLFPINFTGPRPEVKGYTKSETKIWREIFCDSWWKSWYGE